MEPDKTTELQKAHRVTTIIGFAMMAGLGMYAVVVEILKRQVPDAGGAVAPEILAIVRYVFLGLTAAVLIGTQAIKKMLLSQEKKAPQTIEPGTHAPDVQRLVTASVVTYAMCEVPAIFGLVLFMIGRSSFDFYLFMLVSALCFSFSFPKFSAWQEWMQERERMGRRQG